jgi:hypothetical protein
MDELIKRLEKLATLTFPLMWDTPNLFAAVEAAAALRASQAEIARLREVLKEIACSCEDPICSDPDIHCRARAALEGGA